MPVLLGNLCVRCYSRSHLLTLASLKLPYLNYLGNVVQVMDLYLAFRLSQAHSYPDDVAVSKVNYGEEPFENLQMVNLLFPSCYATKLMIDD